MNTKNNSQQFTMKEARPMIGFPGGTIRLFKWLREKKILQKDNTPYQRYIDSGLLDYRCIQISDTKNSNSIQPVVTLKGIVYLQKIVNKDFPKCPPCDER
jgi:anti-repressor protein